MFSRSKLWEFLKVPLAMAFGALILGGYCSLSNITYVEVSADNIERALKTELDNARVLGFVETERANVSPSDVKRVELALGECVAVIVVPSTGTHTRSVQLLDRFDPSSVDDSKTLVRAATEKPAVLSVQYCAGLGGTVWSQLTQGAESRPGLVELIVMRRDRNGFDVSRLNRGDRTAYGAMRDEGAERRYALAKEQVAALRAVEGVSTIVFVEPMHVALLPGDSPRVATAVNHARFGDQNSLLQPTPIDGRSSLVTATTPPLAWADEKWWRVVAVVDADALSRAFAVRIEGLGLVPPGGVYVLSDRRWTAERLAVPAGAFVDDFASRAELRVYVTDIADPNTYVVSLVESSREKDDEPGLGARIDFTQAVAMDVLRAQEGCAAEDEVACLTLVEKARAGFRVPADTDVLARKFCVERRSRTVCRAFASHLFETDVENPYARISEVSCAIGDAELCRELARRARVGEGLSQNLSIAQSFYEQACRAGDDLACSDARTLSALRAD